MRIVSYMYNGRLQAGVLADGDKVVPLSALGVAGGDINALFDLCQTTPLDEVFSQLQRAQGQLDGTLALQDITLVAPIPHPRQDFICLGLNYRDHAEESKKYLDSALQPKKPAQPSVPVYFSKRAHIVAGHNEGIEAHQELVKDLDYEVELACIIGRTARHVSPQQAADYILGYTVSNDVSARTLQTQHQQWYLGKSLDTFAVLGPWIVTADELSFPPDLAIRCHVNGELRQQARTSDMIFDLAYIISDLSRGMTLTPGTIILTGTPAGVGFAAQTPQYLAVGDVVRCEVEGIGVLENRIVASE